MLDTLVVTLLLTLPTTLIGSEWIPPEDRSSFEDSTSVTCALVGPALVDLDSLRFYALPVTGGGWRHVYSKAVRGREGQPDSTTLTFPGWAGAHFYTTTTRIGLPTVEGCASNVAYKGTVTAVEPPPGPPRPGMVAEWYDVHGRRLTGPPAGSCVCFVRWRDRRGRVLGRQTVVVLSGRLATPLRPP